MKDMASQVNIHQAKTQLSRLLAQVAAGEEITIAKAGKPIAKLVPVQATAPKRAKGLYEGQFTVPDDFDAPLPPEILDEFYQ